jgi:hypothetical protein
MPETTLVLRSSFPALVTRAGERARILCFEFFASNIRNVEHTPSVRARGGRIHDLVCAGWRDVDRDHAAAACGMR